MASRSKRSRRPSARLEEGVLCRWMDRVRGRLLEFAPMQRIEAGIQRSYSPLAAFEDVPARSGPKVSFVYKLLKPSDLKPSLVSRSVRGLLSRAAACCWLESSCPHNCVCAITRGLPPTFHDSAAQAPLCPTTAGVRPVARGGGGGRRGPNLGAVVPRPRGFVRRRQETGNALLR